MKVKATIPPGSCFWLGTTLIVAGREAQAVQRQVEKTKHVRRFGYLMDDIKVSLLHASYAKGAVSREARKLAQAAADAEFTYVNGTRPQKERIGQFQKKMTGLIDGIYGLVDQVSIRCGMNPSAPHERTSSDLKRLEARAQKNKK